LKADEFVTLTFDVLNAIKDLHTIKITHSMINTWNIVYAHDRWCLKDFSLEDSANGIRIDIEDLTNILKKIKVKNDEGRVKSKIVKDMKQLSSINLLVKYIQRNLAINYCLFEFPETKLNSQ
jgi:tRNA A-37 threonylcarbamoyl transferase component Bud32